MQMCGVANNAYLHNHTKKRIIRHLMNRTDAVVAQITLIAVDPSNQHNVF